MEDSVERTISTVEGWTLGQTKIESPEVWSQREQDSGLDKNQESSKVRLWREQEYEALHMKLEFPRWDDGDPSGWVSRAEWLFKYHDTLDGSKVEIVSISLEGDAIQWFDWLVACCGEPTWYEFVEGFLVRFGPSAYTMWMWASEDSANINCEWILKPLWAPP